MSTRAVRDENPVFIHRDLGESLPERIRRCQCVVARRPFKRPALARMKAPVHVAVTRRDVFTAFRR